MEPNKSKWPRKKRIIFIVCLLVILFFSQDIAWTVIKTVLYVNVAIVNIC